MSYSNSWLAVRSDSEDSVLQLLGLQKTDTKAKPGRREWGSLRIRESVIVWSPDFEPRRFRNAPSKIQGKVIICDIEEHVMYASVAAFTNGVLNWRVIHQSEQGPEHSSVEGQPPENFERIRAEELARIKSNVEVDFVFDIPLRVAAEASGFRHDTLPQPTLNVLSDISKKFLWKLW